jgi:hypothetical protein
MQDADCVRVWYLNAVGFFHAPLVRSLVGINGEESSLVHPSYAHALRVDPFRNKKVRRICGGPHCEVGYYLVLLKS